MILHATERTEAAMQEKAGAKVVCEIMNTTHPITDTEAETIKNLEAVTSINRMGQQAAYLTDLVPVSASTSTEPSNLKVNLLSFDDMDKDSPFADKSYHLTDGEWIKPETQGSAVINAQFAQANGLKIGDTFSSEKKLRLQSLGNTLLGTKANRKKQPLLSTGWKIRFILIIQLM